MGTDAQLKRLFPVLLCVLIALVAYLQSSGIGQLVAAVVSGPGADGVAPKPAGAAGGTLVFTRPPQKSGSAILARNPFDSVTGPLDGRAITLPSPEAAKIADVGGDPSAEDPSCGFGRVTLITASDDPAWSFAAISDKNGSSKLRRMGDDVSGHTVHAMNWDTVWLTGEGRRCRMHLGDNASAPSSPAAGPSGEGADDARAARRGRRRDLSPEMAAKITKVSETEYSVERSLVDEILENQAELMRTARIVPEKEGDDVVGIRLFGIREGTLLGHLGLKNGDRLDSINGFKMADPQKALEAYGKLRSANKLTVQVNRKGSPLTIDFNIQ